MTDPVREDFQHRTLENLEALAFTIAQLGEVNWLAPVETVGDLPSSASDYDIAVVKADGFVRIYLSSAWNTLAEVQATLGVVPGRTEAIKTVTDLAYTVTSADQNLLLDATSNAVTATLPAVADVPVGTVFHFKAINATNTVTIEGDGSETIDGSANFTLALNASKSVKSNGTAWYAFNQ